MPEDVQAFQLGEATITVVNVGHLPFDLEESLSIPPTAERPARYAPSFAQQLRVPVQCVHIKLPEISVLVDAAVYELPEGEPPPFPARVFANGTCIPGCEPHSVLDVQPGRLEPGECCADALPKRVTSLFGQR